MYLALESELDNIVNYVMIGGSNNVEYGGRAPSQWRWCWGNIYRFFPKIQF